jgi:molecular chaperone GrpE
MTNNVENGKNVELETQRTGDTAGEPLEVDPPDPSGPIDGGEAAVVGEQMPSGAAVQESAAQLSEEIERVNDKYLRLMAEFDNYKRRAAKEYERVVGSAAERVVSELVPVRDNLQRALKAKEEGVADLEKLYEGVKLVASKLDEVLKGNGVETFGEVGEEFDPQVHDALMNVTSEAVPPGHIAEVFERGYRLRDKVIRHAKVIVSSGPQVSGEVTE